MVTASASDTTTAVAPTTSNNRSRLYVASAGGRGGRDIGPYDAPMREPLKPLLRILIGCCEGRGEVGAAMRAQHPAGARRADTDCGAYRRVRQRYAGSD